VAGLVDPDEDVVKHLPHLEDGHVRVTTLVGAVENVELLAAVPLEVGVAEPQVEIAAAGVELRGDVLALCLGVGRLDWTPPASIPAGRKRRGSRATIIKAYPWEKDLPS
jgi:hypothetical protein